MVTTVTKTEMLHTRGRSWVESTEGTAVTDSRVGELSTMLYEVAPEAGRGVKSQVAAEAARQESQEARVRLTETVKTTAKALRRVTKRPLFFYEVAKEGEGSGEKKFAWFRKDVEASRTAFVPFCDEVCRHTACGQGEEQWCGNKEKGEKTRNCLLQGVAVTVVGLMQRE